MQLEIGRQNAVVPAPCMAQRCCARPIHATGGHRCAPQHTDRRWAAAEFREKRCVCRWAKRRWLVQTMLLQVRVGYGFAVQCAARPIHAYPEWLHQHYQREAEKEAEERKIARSSKGTRGVVMEIDCRKQSTVGKAASASSDQAEESVVPETLSLSPESHVIIGHKAPPYK